MGLPSTAKIIRRQTIPSAQPERFGKNDVLLVMQFDFMNTHSVIIPEEEFSEERVQQEAKKYYDTQQEWIGKEISVNPEMVP